MESGKEKTLVSIITVCYNSASTIERTMKSILQQTYEHYEYIVIDGKSTDDTLAIVKKYEPLFQGKMKVFSEPDDGIYDAMNKGIKKASGQLIALLNSDDYYEPEAVATMVGEWQKTREKYMILYGFQRNLKGEREESVVLYHHDYLDKQMITHPTCFVTKQVYEDFGVFDTSYRSSADYEFMLRIYHEGKVTFKPVYEMITNFQTGGMSSSQKGYRETAALQYRYGAISKGRYCKIMIKSKIYEWVHRGK